MAKFKKLVVTPGTFNVGRLGGRSEVVPLTKDRLKGWVAETRKLMGLGVQVPAPFAHQDKDRNFPLPVRIGSDGSSIADAYSGRDGISWDAQINGGFWDQDIDIDPATGGIIGTVDAPGDENDPNSPAGKVGKTVKETSVLVMGPMEVVDSAGTVHKIGEHIAHIAMCMHPSQHGQRNFEPIPEAELTQNPSLQLAMSFCMNDLVGASAMGGMGQGSNSNTLPDPTKAPDQELVDCMAMLRNVTFIDLPETTTREDFITNLGLALRQKSADQQEQNKKEETMTQRPDGASTQSPSIAMSNLVTGTTVTTHTSNPAATPSAADQTLVLFMSQLVSGKKKKLKDRITALVASGRVKKPYADSNLFPKVEVLAMSPAQLTAAGGNVDEVRDPIEDVIEALEQTQPLAGTSVVDDEDAAWEVPGDAHVNELPPELAGNELSDADQESIAEEALVGSGLV